jgi:hypothetical protein
MESLNEQLYLIKKKFPDQNERIEELFESNEDFRALCSDYFLCVEHLHRFKKEFGEKKLSIEEYRSLREELEDELSNFIFNE